MTLQQAHEIQRKELISLRAENARLKKHISISDSERPEIKELAALRAENARLKQYNFPARDKEDLERNIRYLNQVIKTKDRRFEDALSVWKNTENKCSALSFRIIDLEEKVRILESENAILKERAEKAEAEVAVLNGTAKKLEIKAGKNFENSSLPSSALPFRKKVPNSRKPSGKKPGAQPRHIGSCREKKAATSDPIIIPPPESFLNDPDIYPTGRKITKQFVDIDFKVIVQDYVTDEFRRRSNGTRLHAPFPAGIKDNVNYGSRLKSFAFMLNNYYNVSIAKTQQCISDMTKGVISLSTGMISNLSKEFSENTYDERNQIFSNLHHADVLYSDATVSNICGSRKAVILTTDKERVLYQHSDHKGHEGLAITPVNDFKKIIVHDHDRSYYSYGTAHQECLAHVLRYLVSAIENEPHLTWHKKMHSHLQRMIHLSKNNSGNLPQEKIKLLKEQYFSILDTAENEYNTHPPIKEFMDGFNLQKRMRIFADSHLLFLSHPEVDYTNNISERCLRKFKRKQKQSVVFRSTSGSEYLCNALTIIETARMQHQNVFMTVYKAFSKKASNSI